jgi:hypothetical protein
MRATSLLCLLVLSSACDLASKQPLEEDSEFSPFDDLDGDGIIDQHDGKTDADGDGYANMRDLDSDGDSVSDQVESGDDDPYTMPVDSDNDGVADYLDDDSDNNCLSDTEEHAPTDGIASDLDNNGVPDFADEDNDGDGILDTLEIGEGCDPVDHDRDGIPDLMDIDSDGDGIGDAFEAGTTPWDNQPVDTDGDGTPDYLDEDSDNDGLLDSEESGVSSPTEAPRDTDGDGAYDFADEDADGDTISDWDEVNVHGTDPYDSDTDGDGYSDGSELVVGSDPLDPLEGVEGLYVTVPERAGIEEGFEFEARIQRGDVVFVLDTTGSMTSTLTAMKDEFGGLATTLSASIPDTQFGVVQFDDYLYGRMGSPGDKPYRLESQVTDNMAYLQGSLAGLTAGGGNDLPESSLEALYQTLTGKGYDQNCNGIYDALTDVQPFIAEEGDIFAGAGGQTYSETSSGGGTLGGVGFRDHALPIIIYATDNYLRDPAAGFDTPGGCSADADSIMVADAALDRGAYLIGIGARTTTPLPQMEALAASTGSYADTNGDGMANNPLVFEWTGDSSSFRETITDAIDDLVNSLEFETVRLVIEGDEHGFVTDIQPEFYSDIGAEGGVDTLDFTLHFRGTVAATTEDQLYRLTLNVIGDDEILLSTQDILIRVPGESH